MPVRSIEVTDTYVEIDKGGEVLHFDFADFPPSAGDNAARAAHVVEHVQSWLETRIRTKDLPDDEEYKDVDPGLPHFFHEGQGGNKELVARSIVIENVTYDDTRTPPLIFTLRRIWP